VSAGPPRYYFVAIDVMPERADEASAHLFELGAQGVEERDATTLHKGTAGKTTLVASFETEQEARAVHDALGPRARLEEIVGDAWRDAWKEHFRPFKICKGVWIRPPWEKTAPARAGDVVLELEPGRAFGTGLHETTRLVAEVMAARKKRLLGATVLDVGAGSGILALVALALGADSAIGIDTDKDAIGVAKQNAKRNALTKRARFSTTPVDEVDGKFDLVVANIEADVLIVLREALRARLARGGTLVLSGVLDSRERDVVAAFGKPRERTKSGEWVALSYGP
jgi:ribosomal protein L11 methyltransferase